MEFYQDKMLFEPISVRALSVKVRPINNGIRPPARTSSRIITNASGEVLTTFLLKPETILDEVRAGGRSPLLIGRTFTDKARATLGLPISDLFVRPQVQADSGKGFTLAQKIVSGFSKNVVRTSPLALVMIPS